MDTRESYEAAAVAYAEHQSAISAISVIERAHREMMEPSIPFEGVSLSRELHDLVVRGHT